MALKDYDQARERLNNLYQGSYGVTKALMNKQAEAKRNAAIGWGDEALQGAAVGSMIAPGIGTGIGAAAGGLLGIIKGFAGGGGAESLSPFAGGGDPSNIIDSPMLIPAALGVASAAGAMGKPVGVDVGVDPALTQQADALDSAEGVSDTTIDPSKKMWRDYINKQKQDMSITPAGDFHFR